MRLLLDTHVLLWSIADRRRLSADARTAIETSPVVVVSVASVWEIGIKRALGKLDMPEDLMSALAASGFDTLPITLSHAWRAGALPRHHNDPFDRMLIAQAESEQLTVVTADRHFAKYDVRVLAA